MLIVKKFGGTSVADKERMFNVANRCIEEYKKGNDVVVVLSAMGKYTDELISKARDMDERPPKREMDMLLTIGEQMSVSSDGYGHAYTWRSCHFPECISGDHAYYKQPSECKTEKNRYRAHPP